MSTIEEQLKALREETLAALKQISAENEKELQELRVSKAQNQIHQHRTSFNRKSCADGFGSALSICVFPAPAER